MFNILVISYSQSGQLTSILKNLVKDMPFDIDFISYSTKHEFKFPWKGSDFFNTMPETVLEEVFELNPIPFQRGEYDLIILGYQPWFLSPSIPTTALLKYKPFQQIIKDKPIITVIGARNMWLNAQESVKKEIKQCGGKLIGNIPFIDKNNNLVSAITILHWMLTGKKEKKWGFLPIPGVSEKDITNASKFGHEISRTINDKKFNDLHYRLIQSEPININSNILFIEERAKKIFKLWALAIKKRGKKEFTRHLLIKLFTYYLFIALFIIAPIVLSIYTLFIRPFRERSIKRKKLYFCGIELKDE